MRIPKCYKQTADRRWEHIVIAEKALGRALPEGAEVHHVNEIKSDNRGSNLVICPSHAYHMMLHARTRAYDSCGHAGWKKCCYCGQYDAPENLTVLHASPRHQSCAKEYRLGRRERSNTLRRLTPSYRRQILRKKEKRAAARAQEI